MAERAAPEQGGEEASAGARAASDDAARAAEHTRGHASERSDGSDEPDRSDRAHPLAQAEPPREPGPGEAFAPERPHRTGMLVFCPHRLVDSVSQVSPQELFGRGIRGVILDLDNTLVRWQKEDMTEEVTAWLAGLQAVGMRLCILSNSMFSRRSQRIAERLQCSYVRQARKPGRTGFHRAMQAMGTTPAETAIVGDQMFTDVWGGNRAGVYTIMVKPIHPREFLYTRLISRPLERIAMKWLCKGIEQ